MFDFIYCDKVVGLKISDHFCTLTLDYYADNPLIYMKVHNTN